MEAKYLPNICQMFYLGLLPRHLAAWLPLCVNDNLLVSLV